MTQPAHGDHTYSLSLHWEGNLGGGTSSYRSYGRNHRIRMGGKPDLLVSADPTFRGDPGLPNPEELLLAALSSCHMLSYLALCSRHGVVVVAYEDEAHGTMILTPDGGGHFSSATLRPQVIVADPAQVDQARALHTEAHETCFIAASCRFPVGVEPTIRGMAPEVIHA